MPPPKSKVDLDPGHSLLLDVGFMLREQETQLCSWDSLVLLSSSSSLLLAFASKIYLSACNSHFSAFSQPCPRQYLPALSAVSYRTKAIALCSSFMPQKDIFFPRFMVVEHGNAKKKIAATAKAHLSPAHPTTAGGPEPLLQLAVP